MPVKIATTPWSGLRGPVAAAPAFRSGAEGRRSKLVAAVYLPDHLAYSRVGIRQLTLQHVLQLLFQFLARHLYSPLIISIPSLLRSLRLRLNRFHPRAVCGA